MEVQPANQPTTEREAITTQITGRWFQRQGRGRFFPLEHESEPTGASVNDATRLNRRYGDIIDPAAKRFCRCLFFRRRWRLRKDRKPNRKPKERGERTKNQEKNAKQQRSALRRRRGEQAGVRQKCGKKGKVARGVCPARASAGRVCSSRKNAEKRKPDLTARVARRTEPANYDKGPRWRYVNPRCSIQQFMFAGVNYGWKRQVLNRRRLYRHYTAYEQTAVP